MIWVCRAGKNSVFLDVFLQTESIYIPWEGFRMNLCRYGTMEDLKELVRQEKSGSPRTSVSNWAGQLYSFCWGMKEKDYVLIPHKFSKKYTFAEISGEYEFDKNNKHNLWHKRKVKFIKHDIQRNVFSQKLQYSLGAFLTIFKVKDENEVLRIILK